MTYSPLEKSLRQKLELLEFQRSAITGLNASAVETWEHARDFSQRFIRPLDDVAYSQDRFPHELWASAGAAGLKGIIVPEQYGGAGLGNLDLCLAMLEAAKASGAITVSLVCDQALCSRQINTFGTDAQKEKYLPALASGEHVGALAMSEPNAGTDVMSMITRAKQVDGGFKINGSKYWITNGARFDPKTANNLTADTLVLYAKTNDTEKLTAFIVEANNPGFQAGSVIRKATTRGSDTAEIVFDDCFVPDENVLGEVGKGARVLMAGLNVERLIFAANTLGVAQAAFEEVNAYLQQRQTKGKPIAFNQDVAFDLASMYSEIDMAQTYLVNTALQSDFDPQSLTNEVAASVFLQAGDIAERVTTKAQQLHGGMGQTVDCRADRQKGVAALLQVGAGTRQVRLMRIAQSIIPGYQESERLEEALRHAFKRQHGLEGPEKMKNVLKGLEDGTIEFSSKEPG